MVSAGCWEGLCLSSTMVRRFRLDGMLERSRLVVIAIRLASNISCPYSHYRCHKKIMTGSLELGKSLSFTFRDTKQFVCS